jgi:hypothetical protein
MNTEQHTVGSGDLVPKGKLLIIGGLKIRRKRCTAAQRRKNGSAAMFYRTFTVKERVYRGDHHRRVGGSRRIFYLPVTGYYLTFIILFSANHARPHFGPFVSKFIRSLIRPCHAKLGVLNSIMFFKPKRNIVV